MEIKTNNRLDPQDGVGIRFGVVVTLKAMDGINRIDDFIKSCSFNGWLVNQLDVQARVEINQKINEEIEFEQRKFVQMKWRTINKSFYEKLIQRITEKID